MTDSAKKAAHTYVDVLNSTPNGWGQHVCPENCMNSHTLYMQGYKAYGQAFNDEINLIFQEKNK